MFPIITLYSIIVICTILLFNKKYNIIILLIVICIILAYLFNNELIYFSKEKENYTSSILKKPYKKYPFIKNRFIDDKNDIKKKVDYEVSTNNLDKFKQSNNNTTNDNTNDSNTNDSNTNDSTSNDNVINESTISTTNDIKKVIVDNTSINTDFKDYLGNIDNSPVTVLAKQINEENSKNIDYQGDINKNIVYTNKYENRLDKSFIDGDEAAAYLNTYRNEPTRVIYGMTQQYNNLSKYIKDEIDEFDRNADWWGLHEY